MTNFRKHYAQFEKQTKNPSSAKNLARLYLAVFVLILSPIFIPYLHNTSLNTLAIITLGIGTGLYVVVMRMTQRRVWSASSAYLLVFILFHFGAVIPLAFGFIPSPELQLGLSRWFDRPFTHTATLLSLLGVFTYVIGIHLAFIWKKKEVQRPEINTEYTSHFLTLFGFILLLSGIGIWFIIILISGGAELIVGSYRDYLDIAALPFTGYISYAYFAISLGLPLLISTPSSSLKTSGIILFAVWAILAIPLGLRGEALFPLVAAAVIAAKQRSFSVSTSRAILIAIIFLSLIAVTRQVRQVGLSQYDVLAELRFNPMDALVEMGSSLRPVTEVLIWEASGEEYIMGSSYWAPVERLARRMIPGLSRIPAEKDDRLMNVLVQRRVGPIGFSPIAEAYRNFGYIGVGLFMFLMGFIMGRLDRWPSSPVRNACLAVIFVPFLIQIRNDFTPIPFQLITGFLIVQFAVILGKAQLEKSADRPYFKKRVLHNR